MTVAESRVAALREEVGSRGFGLIRGASAAELEATLARFGHVLHVEDVASEAVTNSLVSSRHGLGPHTDHHAVHHIVWSCVAQSDVGGESLLIDGLALVAALPEHHRRALEQVVLAEHDMFDGDLDEFPMLTHVEGAPRLYYSFWLARDDLAGAPRAAFDAFSRALEVVPRHRIRLAPGDVLAVDNHRILHGRTPIGGTTPRQLVRYWLAPTPRVPRAAKSVGG